MWRGHQAAQATLRPWMLRRHHHTSIGGRHRLLSFSRSLGGKSFAGTDKLLQRPPILIPSRSDVLPSSFGYSDVNQRTSNPLLTSSHTFSTRGRNGRPRGPDMRGLQSMEEVITTAYEHLDVMSRRDVCAFWTCISKLMTKRQPRQRSNSSNRGDLSIDDTRHMLYAIFDNTTHGIEDCNIRGLTETILGMAKIVKVLRMQGNKRGEDSSRAILREMLLNKDMKPNKELFQFFANASMNTLDQFDARSLSNLAYAYGLIDYVPEFDDGSDLFDHIATEVVECIADFNEQDISNMVWAYATVKKPHLALFAAMGDQIVSFKDLGEFKPQELKDVVWAYTTAGIHHPKLFEKIANHIVGLDNLDRFKPQELSNTMWAYAKAGIHHPKLFEKVANHIVGLKSLDRFTHPQDVSNTVWAYATAGVQHPSLFEKVANHIIKLDNLDRLDPQALSNTLWAYATAGIHHPKLFEKVANHIVQSDTLDKFDPQALKETAWAFATAQVSHAKLFHKVANAAIQHKEEFNNSQEVANLLWAYATMGIINKQLFSSFVPTATKLIDSYDNQHLANIAWSYAVADVDAPTLFNDHFINKCGASVNEDFRQLHQWHLWQTKEKSQDGLPPKLQDKCYEAFISEAPTTSKFQDDVVAQLSSIGLEPKEEVLMDSGYRIDAIVEVNGKTIGVEVDGPSHFIGKGRSPTGSTILKRRQVPSIDGIELVSVPYWEWIKIGKDQMKKQEYLRELLVRQATDDDHEIMKLSLDSSTR